MYFFQYIVDIEWQVDSLLAPVISISEALVRLSEGETGPLSDFIHVLTNGNGTRYTAIYL